MSQLSLKLLSFYALAGCAQKGSGTDGAAMVDLAPSNALVAARPYGLRIPSGGGPAKPAPLVVLLHGYGFAGEMESRYFGLEKLIDEKGFLYAFPDGTRDGKGFLFWNATDEAGGGDGGMADDLAYLGALIDDVAAHHAVDRKRVFVAGHSNGGFMAYRLACDLSSRVAAIVSLAGSMWKEPVRCAPSEPVAILQVHGDADGTIGYGGGEILGRAYQSAKDSVGGWAKRNGCGGDPTEVMPALDLEPGVPGAETRRERWTGCRAGAAELWTLRGGDHIPGLKPIWPSTIWEFLSTHPKP